MGWWMSDAVPFAAMVFSEGVTMGISTVSKAAMTQGMSTFVLVVYSDGIATLLLFPFFLLSRSLLFMLVQLRTHRIYMIHGVQVFMSWPYSFAGTSNFVLLCQSSGNSSFLGS